MASSSRHSAPAHGGRSRLASDVFRPKFPIDPFANLAHREPWFVHHHALPSVSFQSRRDVLLVLGAPTAQALEPLLTTKSLSNSLLIIATHQPPQIPSSTFPTVRILHLNQSLAIEDAGAVRLVNVLEWAERVARLWRKYGGYGAAILSENNDGQEHLTPPAMRGFRATQSTPPSPRTSTAQLSVDERPPRPRSLSSRLLSRSRLPSLPAVDPSQRPFDGLINFLPGNVAEKTLLKQSILVTTISKPFLVSTGSPIDDRKRGFRLSSKSVNTLNLPPTPPYQSGESLLAAPSRPGKAHLIHVLPYELRSYERSKFVQSLESFLLSFGFPSPKDLPSQDGSTARPCPYIISAPLLGQPVRISPKSSQPASSPYESWPSDCSLMELILCGSLDGGDSYPQSNGVTPHRIPRALLTSTSDVVILPENAAIPPSITVSRSDTLVTTSSLGQERPTGWRTKQRHSSMSSTSSCPSGTHGRSSSPGSPLGPSRTARKSGLGSGLLTPPDSDESGADEERQESVPGSIESGSAIGKGAHSLTSRKSIKMRWKFWKRSIGASA